jgi:hypothetical protein
MAGRFGWSFSLVVALAVSSAASAQFQTRWRDQRLPSSRPSPYLSLLTPGTNRSVVYQGFVRPQLDLQSQIRTQEREFNSFAAATRETTTPGSFSVRGTGQHTRGLSQSVLESGVVERIRGTQSDVRGVNAGHPVYFQYREQYFPGFRRATATP